MKKRSLSLVLAFAMILAMACGAWAASAFVDANGVSKGPADGASGDIRTTGPEEFGLWARNNGGSITYTGGSIKTEGNSAHAVHAQNYGVITGNGAVVTSGDSAFGFRAYSYGDITWVGNIETSGDSAYGAAAGSYSSIDLTGNITTHGESARGLNVTSDYANMKGNVTTYGDKAFGVAADGGASGKPTIIFSGDIVAYGDSVNAVTSTNNSSVEVNGNLTVYGANSNGIGCGKDSVISVTGGTITATDPTGYAMHIQGGAIVNLVDVATEGEHLLKTGNTNATSDASGTLNVSGNSALTGDIIHRGSTSDDTIAINLTDSTWDGAANASDDIGVIDITLVSSDWNITGDTNTNGKVTADSDSNIDFREADENIVVEIDNLAGAPGLNIKLDDVFTINNPDAKDSFQSSDPSVVEVVVDPVTGAVSIIPRSDGDAELTYSYIDETGKIQTVTIGVVSGAGSDPAGGGGGSSNCNSGVGAAVFALLGLAFVYKKK